MSDAERPLVYLRPYVGENPPVLCVGNKQYPLSEQVAALWLKELADFIWHRGIADAQRSH